MVQYRKEKIKPPEYFYEKAKELRRNEGPQIEVIKHYSAAASGYKKRGDLNEAKEVLKEAVEYLSSGKYVTTPELIKEVKKRLH